MFTWATKLHANTHADTVSHWSERSCINDLSHFMGGEPLAGVATQGETIDDQRSTFIDHFHQVAGETVWMNRGIVREFHRAFTDELLVIGPDIGHLFDPRAFPFRS